MLLNTPTARYIIHIVIAFSATFFPLEYVANQPTSKSVLFASIVAGGRAALGALSSTNPGVGKNLI